MDHNEQLSNAIESAGENIKTGFNNLAIAILEAATVYQFIKLYPKGDEIHTKLEVGIGQRIKELE